MLEWMKRRRPVRHEAFEADASHAVETADKLTDSQIVARVTAHCGLKP